MAPLRNHIGAIIGWRAEEQVVGSHARGIVAVMEHVESVWNRPEVQFPTHAMREHEASMYSDPSVSVYDAVSTPRPTTIRFLNEVPKSLFDRSQLTVGRIHTRRRCAGRVQSQTVWDRTSVQFPCDPRCERRFPVRSEIGMAVDDGGGPLPASVGESFDLRVKSGVNIHALNMVHRLENVK